MQALLELQKSVQQAFPLLVIVILWALWPKIKGFVDQVKAKIGQATGIPVTDTIDYLALEKKYGIVGKDGKDPGLDAFRAKRIHEAAAAADAKKKGVENGES